MLGMSGATAIACHEQPPSAKQHTREFVPPAIKPLPLF
jgi:hypothetical protein